MNIFLYILALSLLVCNNGFAGKRNISESKFYNLIEKNGNTGFVEGKEYPEGLLTLPVACH